MIADQFAPGFWVRIVLPGEKIREEQVHVYTAVRDCAPSWLPLMPRREDVDGPVWLNLDHVLSIAEIDPPKEDS